MNCKPDALVYGTVRPIAGSLLVAGALFCLGLMSVRAQTVDLESGLVAYYPFNGNELYFVSDSGGMVSCLDARTGNEQWRERIGGNHSASPLYAGGRLLFHSKEGETTALKPGRKFEILARNKLDGAHHGSAAVSDDALFLRTGRALYRIEKQ